MSDGTGPAPGAADGRSPDGGGAPGGDGLSVLLVGIDAGCLPVLESLFEEGRCPTLEEICTDGAAGPLTSQMPPWTPSAWPSLYTGVNPGKHGVFGFVGYDGYDWHVVSGDDVRERSLWSLLDERGFTSVVVNVPVTHPPEAIDGAVVPGFIAPESPPCHPEGVLEELREAIGGYRIYPQYARGDAEWTDDEKIEEYLTLVRMRADAFSYLADRFDPDFGFVQFQKTDTVFHEFHGDRDRVRAVYEETDDQIAALLERHDPSAVMLASDHGIGPYRKDEFRVNEYLHDRGYVETTQGGKGMPSWNPMKDKLREGKEEKNRELGLVERVAATAARFGITTRRISTGLNKVGLDEVARQYAPEGIVRAANEQVDFPGSTAYMRARTELGVRINLASRDPEGVVEREDYEAVRREVIDDLADVTAPDGEPVFEEVAPREEYFWGPYVEDAVDVVTVPNDFEHFLSAQLLGDYFGEPTEPWNHKLDGIFAAAGEDVDPEADLTDAHLFDVAPTVMAALGVPPSDRMDGQVLPVVEEVEPTTYPEYEADERRSVDDQAVTDRLADLGYLE